MKNICHYMLVASLVVCTAVGTNANGLPGDAEPGDPANQRLAIVNKGGSRVLEELLFRKISASGRFDLVERSQIALILKEQENSRFLSEDSIRLGQLLRARFLVLIEPGPEATCCVLVDTSQGQCLGNLSLPVSDKPDGETAARVADWISACVEALPSRMSGAWRSLAVLPFTHNPEFDKWSDTKSFQALLQDHLSAVPGIVLVDRDYLLDVIREIRGPDASFPEAHVLLKGQSAVADKNTVRIDLNLRSTRSGLERRTTFSVARNDPAASVPDMATWILKALKAEAGAEKTPEKEAAIHYANALAVGSRDYAAALYSYELAYFLGQTNSVYRNAYLKALCGVMERKMMPYAHVRFGRRISLTDKLNSFSRAMNIARKSDPDRRRPSLPFPSFMLCVSTNVVAPLSHGIAVLPVHDTRAPVVDYGKKTTRWINHLLRQTSSFRVVDEEVVTDTLKALGLASQSYQFMPLRDVDRVSKALNTRTIIKAGLYNDKPPVSLHFSVIGGCKSLNGNMTGSFTWDPHREGFVSVARQIVGMMDDNLGYGDYEQAITSQERDRYRDCRIEARHYYEWYCDLEHGMPDPARRKQLLEISPAFCDSPGEAVRSLRALVLKYGSGIDVTTDSVFPKIKYWDAEKSRALWKSFCAELSEGTNE